MKFIAIWLNVKKKKMGINNFLERNCYRCYICVIYKDKHNAKQKVYFREQIGL